MSYYIYTDGSCSLNNVHNAAKNYRGGCAFVVFNDQQEKVYEAYFCYNNTTNNRMEMIAFHKAMEWMKENAPTSDYTIYSDSNNIVQCFASKWYQNWLRNGWKSANRQPIKNVDLWKPIIYDYHKLKVVMKVEKVPAHTSNQRNNYVDTIANKWRYAADEDFINDQQ